MFSVKATTLAALALSLPASAAITGVTGSTTWLGVAPASCLPTALTGTNAFAWDERQNVALSLPVDMTVNPGISTSPTPGVVNGNYDSHFLHFDTQSGIQASGTVTFSAPIAAVIFRNTNLDLSDAPAGALGTTYPTGFFFRGMSTPTSFVSIAGNTLSWTFDTIHPAYVIDQVRVLTLVPAPATAAMLGMAGVMGLRRQRR